RTRLQEANARADRITAEARGNQDAAWRWANVDAERGFDRVGVSEGGGVVREGPRVSALTGRDVPPPVWANRPYGQVGGLRHPLHVDQARLERALADGHGGYPRTPDPKGPWLRLLNAFGIDGDPTRTQNCLDTVAALYDTYVHGRPTVAAPRTFDGYHASNPRMPLGGEAGGPGRMERLTGGRYQSLLADVSNQHPAQAAPKVGDAFQQLHRQLLAGGHGSFASIITAWRGGGSHAWAAVNHDGVVHFIDPQGGRVVVAVPDHLGNLRYVDPHSGQDVGHPVHDQGVITTMDALVVDRNGHPMPFADRPPGTWNTEPLPPEYLHRQPPHIQATEATNATRSALDTERNAARHHTDQANQARQAEQQHAADLATARQQAQDAGQRAGVHENQRDAAWSAAHQRDQVAAQHEAAARHHAEREHTG
ncbi:toxin glutamine deamidase domain-containing protein, partial [Micromonospora zhanjiangensis]